MPDTAPPTAPSPALRPVQRVGAYGLLRERERLLLVRASRRSDLRGWWFLPGGGVRHGEHPREAVLREVEEETGLLARVTALRDVVADVVDLPHRGVRVHTVRVLYDVEAVAGRLRPEVSGTSDLAAFLAPGELAGVPLMPYVAAQVGAVPRVPVATEPEALPPGAVEDLFVPGAHPRPDAARPPLVEAAAGEPVPVEAPRVQRAAAYAVIVQAGRMLLTRLSRSEGLWTLPGGGIDFGESPLQAVCREVHEEAGLALTPGRLLSVDSRRFTGHAPGGRLEDFHGIRVLYEGAVPEDGVPRVVEIGGSTDAAAWIPLPELARLPLTTLAATAVADHVRLAGRG